MYHVKDDKRALVSAQMIYEGLMECLRTKKIEEITVKELVNASGVGRATFYRNFDSPIDVLHMKCDKCFEEVLSGYLAQYNKEQSGRSSLLDYFFSYWMERSDLLEALAAANRMDIITQCHFNHSDIITSFFKPDMDMDSEDYIYFMSLRTGIATAMLSAWVRTGKTKTAQELSELLIRLGHSSFGGDIII